MRYFNANSFRWGLPGFVCEVHANLLQDMAGDLSEVDLEKIMSDWKTNAVHLICLIFCKLSRTREHGLDSAWKSQVNFQEGPAVSR